MPHGARTRRGGIKAAIDRLLARNIETVLSMSGSRLHRRFVSATRDVESTQREVLLEILHYAGSSEFGKKHGFDRIRGYDEYRERVPVVDYEDLRPFVDRHARGEEGVLFPGKPFMYNRSSGTTALPKLIPVTRFNFERTIRDRGKLWLYGLIKEFPGVLSGKDLTLVSPDVEGRTEDGTPYGSLSGLQYRNIPDFVKLVHTIPYSLMTIPHYPSKVYALLRFSLPHDVTVILTTNPSTTFNLVSRADEWKEALIRDIRDGTLRKDLDLDSGIRAEAEALLGPDPGRAAELDRLASTNDRLRPAEYWPNLKLVHTWKNGNCRFFIPKLRSWFSEDTPFLDFGYLSSEITSTDLLDSATDGSILQVRSGFYEFTRFDEGESGDRRFLLAHQLEVGERYFVYVSTFSGLYRYDMNDVVEVVGRFHQAPILRFLFKGKGITNITGEKLSEQQFIEAVGRAAKRTGIGHDFFVGYADVPGAVYRLHIEFEGDPSAEERDAFGHAVDSALGEVNVEYRAKRETDRLQPLQVVSMGKAFFDRYRTLRLSEGAHDGQLKWMQLSSMEATRDRLARLMED